VIDRKVLLPLVGLLAVVVGYLVWGNLNGNLVYYLTPSEAVQQRVDFPDDRRFRLGGLVEVGSVVATADGVRFMVDDGATEIAVVHQGTPPQLFQENVGVVVEGAWVGDEFHSDHLLVKHDEQYRAPDGDEPYVPPTHDN
jgi:cytochrome c-type biogenesis protein CcmE